MLPCFDVIWSLAIWLSGDLVIRRFEVCTVLFIFRDHSEKLCVLSEMASQY